MRFEDKYFLRKIPDPKRLEEYGFRREEDGTLYYTKGLKEETFRAEVRVSPSGETRGTLVDLEFGDEFYQIHSDNQRGAFVAEIAGEYGELLEEIARECFIPQPFIHPQSNRIARKVLEEFGDRPDFPFAKIEGAGVFRNPDNNKWYGLIMEVDKSKLNKPGEKTKPQEKEKIEALNVKVDPEQVAGLIREEGIYECYHMNKKYWVTVALEDVVPDEKVLELLRESRGFTLGKRRTSGRRRKAGGAGAVGEAGKGDGSETPRNWLMPANVNHFDVPAALERDKVLLWKHGTRVRPGDLVYMYFSAPVSAIRYRFRVVESEIDYHFSDEKMNERGEKAMRMELLQEFDPPFPLSEMKRMGVGAVRGPRFIPEELEERILRSSLSHLPFGEDKGEGK